MPGKVNPVMFEMLNQVCFQVLGQDAAVAYMVQAGQMELNVMMPALGSALFDAMDWLTNAMNAATEKNLKGIVINRERCAFFIHQSVALATLLNTADRLQPGRRSRQGVGEIRPPGARHRRRARADERGRIRRAGVAGGARRRQRRRCRLNGQELKWDNPVPSLNTLPMAIQWFPGHMTTARKKAAETMAQIDVVVEVLDARLPEAGSNPMIHELRRIASGPASSC